MSYERAKKLVLVLITFTLVTKDSKKIISVDAKNLEQIMYI